MANQLSLRLVDMTDAQCLWRWRNDPDTRAASHNQAEVTLESHLAWLSASLQKPEERRLWMAERDGVAVGTCRADRINNGWELSWTVSPDARGQGVAHEMLSILVHQVSGTLLAQVKVGNIASMKVAQRAGFQLEKEDNGLLFYRLEKA